MGLGLLLIPSLGGYWFLRHANVTRYEIYRQSGYHLLFQSAIAGIVLAAVGHVITLVIYHFDPQIRTAWYSEIPVEYLDTAILSVLLSLVLPLIINLFYHRDRAAKRTAKRYGDLMELIISDSIERQTMVEMSLQNGKSYIGYALESSIAKQVSSDIAIAPVASGYRSEDKRELHITTHYAPVIRRWRGDDSSIDDVIRDFRVVISRREVCSIRPFDPRVYLLFRQEQ